MKLTKNTTPTMHGKLGNAWLVDMNAALRSRGIENDPRSAVTLPCWIASAGYAHPMWSHYIVMCIALRDAPGVPKAVVHLAGATHEIMVFALDPDVDPAVNGYPSMLLPANFLGQFIADDDTAAAARVQQAVQDMIDGTLNPDTDFRRLWVQRFSGSNLKPGSLDPDFIAVGTGGTVVNGMGASNVSTLQQMATMGATLSADETKPQ